VGIAAGVAVGVGVGVGLLLAGCRGGEEPAAIDLPAPTASAVPSAAPACLPFRGPPDGSPRRPYLKRAMALECREDVKRLQQALGLSPDGFFDFATAAAVIARQRPYACITAGDGQVGPQTWALIVEGIEPCEPGRSPAPVPAWARCGSADAAWALRAQDGTVLRGHPAGRGARAGVLGVRGVRRAVRRSARYAHQHLRLESRDR